MCSQVLTYQHELYISYLICTFVMCTFYYLSFFVTLLFQFPMKVLPLHHSLSISTHFPKLFSLFIRKWRFKVF
jgi:hypothetical protein